MKTLLANNSTISPFAEIQGQLASELEQVEAQLNDATWGPVPVMSQVSEHLIDAGGKRLRPILTLLSAKMNQIPLEYAISMATASEMIHTASLLHDDVVDQTPLRRGKPAAPRKFGNATCVLVGDALMARALVMLAELECKAPLESLARCVRRMAVGEIQQLVQSGYPHPRLLGYFRVIEGKTSALFAWCTTVGDMLSPKKTHYMRCFGRRLGMAFQIADDILDYTGDPTKTGKRIGSDLSEGKFTLPLHFACEADPSLREKALEIGEDSAWGSEQITNLVADVNNLGGVTRAQEIAETLLTRAQAVLEQFPPTSGRDHLHQLADFVVRRSY